MLSADLLGMLHVKEIAKSKKIDVFAENDEFPVSENDFTITQDSGPVSAENDDEALKFFKNRIKLPSKTINSIIKMARLRTPAISKELLKQIRGFIDTNVSEAIADGSDFRTFRKNFDKIMARAGLDPVDPHRLETIFRTNIQTAYNAGRWNALQQLKDIFEYYQYLTVGDSAVRPTHAAMHGKIYAADDPIWQEWWPPNGYNCRCSVSPLIKEEVRDEKLVVSKVLPKLDGNTVRPDVGFKFNAAVRLAKNPEVGLD